MNFFQRMLFRIGLETIERAYREGRKAFDEEIAQWNANYEEHQAAAAAGPPEDEDDQTYSFDYGDHVGTMIYEAEECIRLLRDAFVLTLYHFWEKQALELLNRSTYNYKTIYAAAKAHPELGLDDPTHIDRLRMMSNCIKHDKGHPLYEKYPEMFDPQLVPEKPNHRGWHQALRVSDADLEAAFAAVRAAGPKPKPKKAVVEDVED